SAVHVDQQVDVAVVAALYRRARLDVDDAAGGEGVPPPGVPRGDRHRPPHKNERLPLPPVGVAGAPPPPPQTPRGPPPGERSEAERLAELGDVPRRLPRLVRARSPREVLRAGDSETHRVPQATPRAVQARTVTTTGPFPRRSRARSRSPSRLSSSSFAMYWPD